MQNQDTLASTRIMRKISSSISLLYFLFMKKGQFSVSRIYVKDLLAEGAENGSAELRPHKYSVVRADQSYCGEIEVGITFTRKVTSYSLLISLVMQTTAKNISFSSYEKTC